MVQHHPDRLVPLSSPALQFPELAAEQLDYAVNEFGHRGASILGHSRGKGPSTGKYDPFWAKAEELGIPQFMHPDGSCNIIHPGALDVQHAEHDRRLIQTDPKAADLMIDRLGDLLRMTLHTSGIEEVSLKEELGVLQTYLATRVFTKDVRSPSDGESPYDPHLMATRNPRRTRRM